MQMREGKRHQGHRILLLLAASKYDEEPHEGIWIEGKEEHGKEERLFRDGKRGHQEDEGEAEGGAGGATEGGREEHQRQHHEGGRTLVLHAHSREGGGIDGVHGRK